MNEISRFFIVVITGILFFPVLMLTAVLALATVVVVIPIGICVCIYEALTSSDEKEYGLTKGE